MNRIVAAFMTISEFLRTYDIEPESVRLVCDSKHDNYRLNDALKYTLRHEHFTKIDIPRGETAIAGIAIGPLDSGDNDKIDAARYRFLRDRNLDTIGKGGVFAGLTPDNVVLNGEDLDAAIDAVMTYQKKRIVKS